MWYRVCKINHMLKNFTLLFFRNFRRQKLFSIINLLGLTVSIASTLVIYLFVRHEFSFDTFHPGAERVFRVNQTFIWGQSDNHQFGSTGPGVGTALREELPEIELMTRLTTQGDYIGTFVNSANEVVSFEEKKVVVADSNFFEMFNFKLIRGNPKSALRHANTIIMTASTASRYFQDADPLGKQIVLGSGADKKTYEVTGVMEDVPDNTYFQFDMLMSMESFPVIRRLYWSWVWTQLETYVRFPENTNMVNIRERLAKIPPKHAEKTLKAAMGVTYNEYIKSGKKWELFLQPMTSLHLPEFPTYNRVSTPGNKTIVYSLIGAGIFIILLSCVNFMNLSTAQFMRRIKEASIRKILGIGKRELSVNYFLEAVSFCFIALIAALALSQMLLPAFNSLSGKTLSINLVDDPGLAIALGALVLVMALLSCSYPALFLTTFHPVEAMKGRVKSGTQGKAMRHGLVVFQFAASFVLVICTAVIFEQLKYVSEKDLGFDKENLMVLSHVEAVKNGETMVNAVKNVAGISNATLCTSIPPYIWGGDSFSSTEGDKKFQLNFTTADENFVPTLGVKLKFGRNFSLDSPADSTRVLLNETAVKAIGWAMDESVLGKKFEYPGSERRFEVIGIMEDFNYWALQAEIQPMAVFHHKSSEVVGEGQKKFVGIRVDGMRSEQWGPMLASLEAIWKEQAGDTPFQYSFVDESFADAFRSEEKFGKGLTVLAGLSIMIACLGLLGIIIYALELRTKEIGIRKISGASTWNILRLITGGYAVLIMIAFVIGAPLSWWMMSKWLEAFAYRITPSPWMFAYVGLGTLLIAVTITAYHTVKAANMNPVDVLRDE